MKVCNKCGSQQGDNKIFCTQCEEKLVNPISEKDELKVEHYDAAEAETKKKRILVKVGLGVVGAAALLTLLGIFGLIAGWWGVEMGASMGGAGAWFNSRVIFLEDENG